MARIELENNLFHHFSVFDSKINNMFKVNLFVNT